MIGKPSYVPPKDDANPELQRGDAPNLTGMVYLPPNHCRVRSGYYDNGDIGKLLKSVLKRGKGRGFVEAGTIRWLADMLD